MQRAIDLANDLIIELSARRGRVLLILVAVMLSTGALVASIGISNTAASQIDADLAASSTDRLIIETVSSPLDGEAAEAPVSGEGEPDQDTAGAARRSYFPEDAEERVGFIRTVNAAGLRLPQSAAQISRGRGSDEIASADSGQIVTIGATSNYLRAVGADVGAGWMLDHAEDYRIALIGESVAQTLQIPLGQRDYTGYRVYVDDVPYDVVAVLPSAERAELSNSILLPYETVLRGSNQGDTEAQMFVHTAPGAGGPVSDVIREAIRPEAPNTLQVSTVADLETLRTGVSSQLSRLAGAIGIILLALTALLIANSMIVSVVARTAEIGLRRALGASRTAIATLFLADGALTGFLGGVAGSAFGAAAVVTVAWASHWTALLNPLYLLAGPVVGTLMGTIASAYPAWQAARVSPADAVRSE